MIRGSLFWFILYPIPIFHFLFSTFHSFVATSLQLADVQMENSNFLYPNTDRSFIKHDDLAYIVTEWVCAVLAVIGNALVLLVYWSDRNSQKIIHKYIVSMALADLLMGLIGVPPTIYVSVGWPQNRFWCLQSISLFTSFSNVSVLALVATSTAKYMSLAHPFWFSSNFNDLKAKCRLCYMCSCAFSDF